MGYSIEPKSIAWSPDGSKIAFEAWRLKGDGIREPGGLIVMNTTVNGGPAEGVIVTPEVADKMRYMVPATPDGKPQNPHWSTDVNGTRLIYELVRANGKRDLCVINSDARIHLT